MEMLYSLKTKLNIKNEDFDEILFEIENINKKLQEENIILNEQFRIGLYSHMVSFIMRLKSNEKVSKISDEVISQLDQESTELSKIILEPLFRKYDVGLDMSEVVLVAIHLQTIKESNKERSEMNG